MAEKETKDDSWRIPSKLAISVIGILLGAAISFNAWAVSSIGDRPTREDVKEMIVDKSPYKEDRSMILQALTRYEKSNLEVAKQLAELRAELTEWKMLISRDR